MDRNQILNDPETATRYALSNLQSQMWTAIPAIVQSVDFGAMTVVCTPAINGVSTDLQGKNTPVQMPQLLDVLIVFPSAGGFSLTLPIKAGDEVLVVIASRCIDAWWQNGGFQNQMEFRMHDLSDAFAIPGPRSQPRVVSGISSDNVQLRSDDGSIFIELTPGGKVNITAPSDLTLTGNLVVTGNITATQEVTAKSATLPVHLSTHVHTGVTPGGSNTGGPLG